MPTHHFVASLPGTRVALAGVNKGFNFGAVQVAAHDPHAFAIPPVKFAVLLVQLELLGSERATRGNNVVDISSVQIRPLDGTVVGLRLPMLVQ